MLSSNRRTGEILVTGGAGYIGSHVVLQLVDAGHSVVVLDNLSNGSAEAVMSAELVVGDLLDFKLLKSIFQERDITTVLQLAALAVVSDSVSEPGRYYRNNVGGTANLVQCAAEADVHSFVFSSTAAVYGIPEGGYCDEDMPTAPINPYGQSKLMAETILADVCEASAMRNVTLRYFNVAGADCGGNIGQQGRQSTHITKVACEAAVGKREHVPIFGNDYPTEDGTCIRDYIHVEDLAAAHLSALDYLASGGESTTLNCGYGYGYSVREILRAVEKAAGHEIPQVISDRRPGDPPVLVARTDRINDTLDWAAKFDDLDTIVSSALRWEKRLEAGDDSVCSS